MEAFMETSVQKMPRQRLQRGRFTIDVTGLSGRPLYSRSKSKFCADVSKYATR